VSTTYKTAPAKTVNVGGTKFAYRQLGTGTGVPVIFLNHLAAVLDNWDPRIIDGIASRHRVVVFDNRGVGASQGKTPTSVPEMARDAIAFIRAMGFDEVDVFGFSLGGMVAQELVLQQPELVRKLILTGTGPAGGTGIDKVTGLTYLDMARGAVTFRDAKRYLFFTQTANGQQAARQFLERLKERTEDRDKAISVSAFRAQLKAIHAWGLQEPSDLGVIKQPTLVANGESDRMVPSSNTVDLAQRLPNSRLVPLYPDAGHGGIFQYYEEFLKEALVFLEP
jgi:pimeloyl-ACP methyl ester carboxylesterase